MDKQTTLFGISNVAWGIMGILALVALVILAFALDIGPNML